MISDWPVYQEEYSFKEDEEAVETIKAAVKGIRNVRAELNVPPSKKATVIVVSSEEKIRRIFEDGRIFFATLGYAGEVILQADKTGILEDAVSAVIPGATVYMPFAELVDIEKEIERLTKEKNRLEKEVARSEGMLGNERFISKAPKEKIEEEKDKLVKYTDMLGQVTERLQNLKK